MNDDTRKLFERVAKKMGWADEGGLDTAEKKLISSIGKTRHAATSSRRRSVDRSASPGQLILSDNEDDPEKENQGSKNHEYRNKSLIESSDEDFDQFLVERATPKAKPTSLKSWSSAKKNSSTVLVKSSDDEDCFERFLQRVKTPNVKPKKTSESGSEDSLKNFLVDDFSSDDDFIETKASFKVPKKSNTPAAQHPLRRPLSQCDSPVFVSDSDDDDNIVVKSTWRIRKSKPEPPPKDNKNALRWDEEDSSPSLPLPPVPSPFSLRPHKTLTSVASPKPALSGPSKLDESTSSEEEFTSLLERLKKKNKFTATPFSPRSTHEFNNEPPGSPPPVTRPTKPVSKSLSQTPLHVKTPGKSAMLKPAVSQTEYRHGPTSRVALCKTPGCFLQSLSNPGSSYSCKFKQNKEELTSRLYQLYNTSVFDSKLPIDMSVTWNKKMRKTAGYCITGQERGGGSRYARIELSEKVCDCADRLRDTLIHEMCHAATWLINGVRDGHGNFWKLYARKSTLAHPELPMVTRCHSYDIKYKFQYQCTRCKNTIGRHSKSLDTQKFACAICTGQLVLLTPAKPRAPTPFANFVKENFGTVRQELAGQSHGEVMRKLSADFASKTKLSQS
ncbi:acidic repeat-containing protein [Etheostoma cragini]|uniref:acidic repeat-containing protein n=1 Tax=Etheostoma cragini TaxID=417921 RepID=UPI00155E4346|nr:acidic repeat-containing protein [Etheostoma cragini]XP_034740217.1 acidic repeat-containing protein [Etheostoma cragini]XP_034740218.1 acidic repeat-containing protein [Etheostoma cragini]XP_034740219.1 acidic repeat-containing protein [Etheostoma cragini]